MSTAYITHADCLQHEMGRFHPECPERLQAIADAMRASGVLDVVIPYDAPLAAREELARIHPQAYLDMLEASSPRAGLRQLDPDTIMNPFSLNAAKRAAGAVVMAVDLVLEGKARTAFCAVRPPGHHAERAAAMGFCFFNNVAVGAAHALSQHGLRRVAVVDFDVHHGNGTEEIFTGDHRVLMVSTFQYPLYPYCGVDSTAANMVNVPLSPGADGAEFRKAVETHWIPALERFEPELILISAGFDAHREDDLANLNFVEADYAWVTRQLVQFANRACDGRIVSTLEGGYALEALGRSVVAHVKELALA